MVTNTLIDLIIKDRYFSWYHQNEPTKDNIPDDLIPKTKLQEIQEEKAKRKYNKRFKRE